MSCSLTATRRHFLQTVVPEKVSIAQEGMHFIFNNAQLHASKQASKDLKVQ